MLEHFDSHAVYEQSVVVAQAEKHGLRVKRARSPGGEAKVTFLMFGERVTATFPTMTSEEVLKSITGRNIGALDAGSGGFLVSGYQLSSSLIGMVFGDEDPGMRKFGRGSAHTARIEALRRVEKSR